MDPVSQVTGGSVLGDAARMAGLAGAARAFVRGTPARGRFGGVARGTREAVELCERAGYGVVLVESVGAGQGEEMIAEVVDVVVLVVRAGVGDALQGIKRGLTERADVIVVNGRAGVGGTWQTAQDYAGAAGRAVLGVSARTGEGVGAVWGAVEALGRGLRASGALAARRADQRRRWLRHVARSDLLDQ